MEYSTVCPGSHFYLAINFMNMGKPLWTHSMSKKSLIFLCCDYIMKMDKILRTYRKSKKSYLFVYIVYCCRRVRKEAADRPEYRGAGSQALALSGRILSSVSGFFRFVPLLVSRKILMLIVQYILSQRKRYVRNMVFTGFYKK